MAEMPAMIIERITGSGPTNDGNHILLKCVQLHSTEAVLVYPKDRLLELIEVCAKELCRGQSAAFKKTIEALTVKGWETGTSEGRDGAILSLNIGAGDLSFYLSPTMLREICEALGILTGQILPIDPDSSVH